MQFFHDTEKEAEKMDEATSGYEPGEGTREKEADCGEAQATRGGRHGDLFSDLSLPQEESIQTVHEAVNVRSLSQVTGPRRVRGAAKA